MIPYRYALRRRLMQPGEIVIASGQCGDDAFWKLNSKKQFSISGTGAMYDFTVSAPWEDYLAQISNVSIMNSITNIGNRAFAHCFLRTIDISDSVTSIGNLAFYGCSVLISVTMPDSITNIGTSVFNECSSLESVVLSNSLESISASAFANCENLTSISVPTSVAVIEARAFYRCNQLTDVYYTGTQQQWEVITIGAYNEPLFEATIHYNS